MSSEYPRKFIGETSWQLFDDVNVISVSRAIFRSPDELVIEFTQDNWLYTVPLKRNGDMFRAEWEAKRGGEKDNGVAECRLYTSQNDIILFGTWTESNKDHWWWFKPDEVKSFSDEQ